MSGKQKDRESAAPSARSDEVAGERERPLVLVTGGSRGLGRSIVEVLASSGYRVVFTFRRQEEAALELAKAYPGQAHTYCLDLAERGAERELVRKLEERHGPLWGLVNNAGITHSGLLAMTSDDDFDSVLDVNLGGVFRCCRAVVPLMIRRRRGAIVNVASLAAVRGVAGQALYAASKAGVLALTRSLAREVGGRGVRVNAVVPGFVATDMTESLPEAAVQRLRANEALRQGVEASQVAAAVRFLMSEESGSITGQSLTVDAGASI